MNPKQMTVDSPVVTESEIKHFSSWGEELLLPEWNESTCYREQQGWKGRDLIHSSTSAVRVLEYRIQYGQGGMLVGRSGKEDHHIQSSDEPSRRGGVGTTLRGIVHFTSAAESHKGLCHGGAMCSAFDDVIGWTAFCVKGVCIPWSGYTVEVNTRLMKPVPLGSLLELSCTIVKVDRRKVYLSCSLTKHRSYQSDDDVIVYAHADGLVILNKELIDEDR